MLKTVKELSKELSIKLGDQVSGGDSDGEIFSSDQRLGYINRAYGKLSRVLKSLMRDEAPEFTKLVDYVFVDGKGTELKNYSNVYKIEPFIKIIDVFAGVQKSGTDTTTTRPSTIIQTQNAEGKINQYPFYKAERIDPNEFLSVVMQKNTLRTPSFEKGQIYYTVLNKNLYFLPQSNGTYEYQGYYMTKLSNLSDLTLDTEIYITNNYLDLLVLFGAYEGMMDIARADKVQLYGQEINGQLQILSQYAQLEKREEGISEQRSE